MKPPEILGLLEEAAGTKMYEDKKRKAVATLEKKQLKVDEINKVGAPGWALRCWLSGGRAAADAAQAQPWLAAGFVGQGDVVVQHLPACPSCSPPCRC